MKKDKIHNDKIVSFLTLNAYTINPVKDKEVLKVIIDSLCAYDINHQCDFTDDLLVHKNYLGKINGEVKIDYINNCNYHGLIAYCLLENGYFVLKIWDNIYPAEVQFDLYLDEKIEDISLIIDHLSCPATPFDGLGLFNITYSLTNKIKDSIFLTKENRSDPPYDLNYTFDFKNYTIFNNNKEEYKYILNELTQVQCFCCPATATNIIFHGHPKKAIPICDFHKNDQYGRETNFSPGPIDIRVAKSNHFKKENYTENDITYTKNVSSNDIVE